MPNYTVRNGDTLSGIASRFGTTWQRLASINHLRNPNILWPGQRLIVPNVTASKPAPAPSSTRNPVAAAAVRKALATFSWRTGMCDNFCAGMYGRSASGYATAVAHWNAIPAKHRSTTGIPPEGAIVFWAGGSRGYGHAAVAVGGWKVRTIDMDASGRYSPGTVATVPLSWITERWGQRYLGWADPIFGGRLVVDL